MTHVIQTNSHRSSKVKDIALWFLQALVAAAFLIAGVGKVSGQPLMVQTFEKIGVGQWFRYVTGGIEVSAAILLLIPRFTPIGAALLVFTMIGAVITHLAVIGGSPVPPLMLGVFAGIILWGRFNRVAPLLRRSRA